METLSPEARDALAKNGFDKDEQRWLATQLEQLLWLGEAAGRSLTKINGGRPVNRRKFGCALDCMMFFYELKPEHTKREDDLLIEFAEETLRLVEGGGNTEMRHAINNAFDLGF